MNARKIPRLSMSKLAEYMVATPSRRRTLLRDQKFPPAFKVAWFDQAFDAIADVLRHGMDPSIIEDYLARWRRRTPKSTFEADRLRLWIEALSTVARVFDANPFAGLSLVEGPRDATMTLGGVKVSIRPELLCTGSAPGAVKIYLNKSVPLTDDDRRGDGSGTYAATLLYLWAAEHLGSVAATQCRVLDVFAGRIYGAPKAYVRRRHNLHDACEEIAVRWASIEPPLKAA